MYIWCLYVGSVVYMYICIYIDTIVGKNRDHLMRGEKSLSDKSLSDTSLSDKSLSYLSLSDISSHKCSVVTNYH